MARRVVITGVGTVNPLGNDVPTTWKNLLAGKSGIDTITHFDPTGFGTRFGGEVKDFDPEALFGKRAARRMDRFTQFALAAGMQAVEDSGILEASPDRTRIGTVIGSGIGGLNTILAQHTVLETKGVRRVSPFFIPMILPDTAAAQLAIEYRFQGPSMAIVSACASGTNAVGEAFEMVARGSADAIIAGGADSLINPLVFAGFAIMKAFSTRNDDPVHSCRPFDSTRDGFVASEGSALLVLEELEHARARGAHIYAEVIGYGTSVDADNMAAPLADGSGASLAMKNALRRAQIEPEAVDYINAHGTATRLNDVAETKAIKTVLGEHAYNIAISSTKSMTGHLLGGAGALEALICAKTLQTDTIAPTINLHDQDPECDLYYTPNQPEKRPVNIAMSNSFGFGGHNATIVLRKYTANGNGEKEE